MITKKEITFFAIAAAAISIMSFGFNYILPENKEASYSVQKDIKTKTASFKQSYTNTKIKSLKRRNKDLSSIKKFRNKLENKTFTFDDFKVSKNKRTAKKGTKDTKKKVAKKDSKKKKAKKKKVAKKTKKRELRPSKIAKAPELPGFIDGIETAELSSKATTINTPLTSRQNTPAPSDQNSEDLETEDKDSATTIGATAIARNNTVEAQNVESIKTSVYSTLLAEGNFLEFEQLLQTNLSESERVKSYTAALNFLFEQTEENFQGVDTFIMTQFKNHRHAIVVSKSLANSNLSSNQLIYSVELLTDLIGSWSLEQGSEQFRTIYQERVAENIPTTNENQELFSSLQTSIDLKLVSLTDSNVEVSLN